MSKYIITGCGRSGTGLAAEILRGAGLQCGHESVFKLTTEPYAMDWGKYDADSSWCAVPYLINRELYTRAILLVRDPLDVVRSWLQLDLLSDVPPGEIYRDVANIVYRFRREVRRESTQVNRCAAMWLHWNQAALPYVDEVVQLEDMSWDSSALLSALKVNATVDVEKLGVVNAKNESKQRVGNIEWSDIRPALRREMHHLAERLGYDWRWEVRA